MNAANFVLAEIPTLLRGESESHPKSVLQWNARSIWLYVTLVCVGAGLYGIAMGSWRDPLQSLYTALKFPLVILLTTLANALLNGMLAPLLGMNIGLRQSLMAVLMS